MRKDVSDRIIAALAAWWFSVIVITLLFAIWHILGVDWITFLKISGTATLLLLIFTFLITMIVGHDKHERDE